MDSTKKNQYFLEGIIPVLLCISAGGINSFGFLSFGSFVSHMSGHATHLGVDFLEKDFHFLISSVLILVGFLIGAILSSFYLKDHSAFNRKSSIVAPLLIELWVMIAVFSLLWLSPKTQFSDRISCFLLAVSLGIQNATIRESMGCIIRTTHVTGVWTDLGMSLGRLLKIGFDRKNTHSKFKKSKKELKTVLILSVVFFSFIFGCTIGVYGSRRLHEFFLMFPILVMSLCLVAEISLQRLKQNSN